MSILSVRKGGLSFGCLRAYDMNGNESVILIHENINHSYIDIIPQSGDILWCRNLHSSVYIPLFRIVQAHVCLRSLPIPCDILREYFPIQERLHHSKIEKINPYYSPFRNEIKNKKTESK